MPEPTTKEVGYWVTLPSIVQGFEKLESELREEIKKLSDKITQMQIVIGTLTAFNGIFAAVLIFLVQKGLTT